MITHIIITLMLIVFISAPLNGEHSVLPPVAIEGLDATPSVNNSEFPDEAGSVDEDDASVEAMDIEVSAPDEDAISDLDTYNKEDRRTDIFVKSTFIILSVLAFIGGYVATKTDPGKRVINTEE